MEAEYALSRDYAEIIMLHNSGSTIIVHVDPIPNRVRPKFERMYMCLLACINGLKNGWIPFIALDGCHLKGSDDGQLLCVITKDANNALLPMAYAWVEAKNTNSWTWFIG